MAALAEWDEFRLVDYQRVFASMKKPAFAFDCRNILPHQALRELGFEQYAVGK